MVNVNTLCTWIKGINKKGDVKKLWSARKEDNVNYISNIIVSD